MASGFPEPVLHGLEARAKAAAADSTAYADLFARGASMRHAAYNQAAALRQQQRAAWGRFFGDWDVFLCPVVPMAAFPHDHSPDMLSRRLARRGYDVVVAEDGARGLAAARADAPSLILLDLVLPDTDGRNFLGRLRETLPTARI